MMFPSTLPDETSTRRGLRRPLILLLCGTILGLLVLLGGPATIASAHAELLSSSPAAGSVSAVPPDHITLTFGENVEISLGAIRLLDGTGNEVSIGPAEHPAGDHSAVTVSLPVLAEGSYVVDWQVISADSHQVHAAYTFQVGTKTTLQSGVIEAAIAGSGTGRAAGGALDASRGLVAAGFAVVLGSLVAVAAGIVTMSKRLRLTIVASGLIAAAAGLVAIPLEAGYAANRSLSVLTDGSAWRAVMQTQVGRDWLLRAVLIGVGTLVLANTTAWSNGRGWRIAASLTALAVALTFAFGGHGDTGRWHLLGIALTVVHVLAMGIWLGGLVALMLVMASVEEHRVRQFSRLAFVSVAAVVVTGSIQAVRQLGSVSALTSTRYGQLLIWKLVAVALVLFVASMSRRLVYGRVVGVSTIQALPAGAAVARLDRETLRRSVTLEVIFGVVILAVTSSLMAANPSAAGNFKPYASSLTQSGYVASISLDPARVGSNQLHVYLSSINSSLDNPDNVTVELSDPARNVAPLELTVTPAGPSHYVAVAELPYAAKWTMTITARYHTFDQVIFRTVVAIRA